MPDFCLKYERPTMWTMKLIKGQRDGKIKLQERLKEGNLQLGWMTTGDGNGGINICKYSKGEIAKAEPENNMLTYIFRK